MRRPVNQDVLRDRLEVLVAAFDVTTISPDPLEIVLRYDKAPDQEVAGIIAAAFAYGRADTIVRNIGAAVARMGPSPYDYLQSFERLEAEQRFAGFVHRFHKARDFVDLLERLSDAVREHGSLGALFAAGYDDADPDIGPSLGRFVTALLGAYPSAQLEYLLTNPARGSACKRMNLYLRWMVRRTSPDLGLWTFADPARLIMPVDTHIHRIATFLGLGDRKSADWKAALAITESLRRFDCADPVRYDFALCRLGILDLCSRQRLKANCDVCMLRDVCRFPVLDARPGVRSKASGGHRRRRGP